MLFFTFTFPLLSFLPGRLFLSITSPWDQVALTRRRRQQQQQQQHRWRMWEPHGSLRAVLEGGAAQHPAPGASVPVSRCSENPWNQTAPWEYRGWLKNNLSMGRKAGQPSVCLSALAVLLSWARLRGTELMHIHTHVRGQRCVIRLCIHLALISVGSTCSGQAPVPESCRDALVLSSNTAPRANVVCLMSSKIRRHIENCAREMLGFDMIIFSWQSHWTFVFVHV